MRREAESSGSSRIAQTVRRLWSLCSILRDEGVTYHEYLTELTYLLFLKLAAELGLEKGIPQRYRWDALVKLPTSGSVAYYKELLNKLGRSSEPRLAALFADGRTRIGSDEGFSSLIHGLNSVSWSESRLSQIGDIYEGLIAKNAQEARYGAGQYFTPRPLVETIVSVLDPRSDDTIYDPAAGTAGFLLQAGLAAREKSKGDSASLFGVEISTDVHRLGLANLLLHDLDATYVVGDALTGSFPPTSCSLCMTNPPFGVKGSVSKESSTRLTFPTSNKQLAFVQHVYSKLGGEGRAAIIVPDNVLFEGGVAASVRGHLMDEFNLHTVLRLPPKIFYATGVKTSVLFFSSQPAATERVWCYDLRSRAGLTQDSLSRFKRAYGSDPHGRSVRRQTRAFRYATRSKLAEHGNRLDFADFPSKKSVGADQTAVVQLEVLERELDAARAALSELIDLLRHAPDPPHPHPSIQP